MLFLNISNHFFSWFKMSIWSLLLGYFVFFISLTFSFYPTFITLTYFMYTCIIIIESNAKFGLSLLSIISKCDAHFQTNILVFHKTNGLSTIFFLHLYYIHLIMNILFFLFKDTLSFNKHFHDTIIIFMNIKALKFFVYTKLFTITHIYSKFLFC
jgi:hypothetical protein